MTVRIRLRWLFRAARELTGEYPGSEFPKRWPPKWREIFALFPLSARQIELRHEVRLDESLVDSGIKLRYELRLASVYPRLTGKQHDLILDQVVVCRERDELRVRSDIDRVLQRPATGAEERE